MAWQLGTPDISDGTLRAALARAQIDAENQRHAADLMARMQQHAESLGADVGYKQALMRQRGEESAAERSATEADRAALGTTIDLGEDYRGILDGRGGIHIVDPPKTFSPDAATTESLRQSGYVWAPQSKGGGTFLPVKGESPDPTPGTTTDLGGGYREVIGAGGKAHRVGPPPTPKADPMTDLKVKGLVAELADLDGQLAEHTQRIGTGDKRHGFLNMLSREETAKELTARRAKAQTELDALKGSAVPAAAHPAAVQTPASTAPPAPPKPADSGRVTVQKDGKRFSLPVAQLEEAKRQGYTPL